MKKIIILIINLFFITNIYATPSQDTILFHNLFNNWTAAFNQKDLNNSCNLFSRNITADYRGIPTKNYESICNGFKKVFQEKNKKYIYSFKIHHIYHENNLAAVRITWYLKIYKGKALLSSTHDEGLDILEKNKDGKWQIVNYLGYSV